MKITIPNFSLQTEDFEITIGDITIEGASEAFTEKFGGLLKNMETDATIENKVRPAIKKAVDEIKIGLNLLVQAEVEEILTAQKDAALKEKVEKAPVHKDNEE